MSGPVGAAGATTLTVKEAVTVREPDVPVAVTVALVGVLPAAAVSAIVCGAELLTLAKDGLAVTPAGRPESETATVPVKPFTGATVRVTGTLPPPAIRELPGCVVLRVKVGCGVTVSATLAFWVTVPPVATTATVALPAATDPAAVNVKVACEPPDVSVKEAGDTVTPAGRFPSVTPTGVLKLPVNAAETVTWALAPPCTLSAEGVTASAKLPVLPPLQPESSKKKAKHKGKTKRATFTKPDMARPSFRRWGRHHT